MGIVNFRYKYVFATICLLGIFLCGYNFNRWDAANGNVKKNIFIIYSFSKNDVGNGNFEEYAMNGFRKEGIEPFFHRFYLGCDSADLSSRTALVKEYLEIIKNRQIDMILTVGDQSASALLSTRHPFLQSVPVVACNVRFPDEKLLAEYDSARVYVLRDVPDFRKNIEFIRTLQAHTNLEILYNIDFTPLGRKSFDLLTQVVDRQNVRMSCSESSFPFECDYRELKSMVEYYTLMPAVAREEFKKNKLTVSLCPFRYMKGGALLVMMEKSEDGQGRKAFLMDRFDAMALPVVHALDMPAFSCLREGFGEEARIVGGYMATDETSAAALVALSVRVLGGGKAVDAPRMADIEKEYVLDWTYFSAYDGYDIKNVPADVRIINYPFYVHYREELYLLGGVFVLAFVLVSVILLRTRRRSRIEHENLAMLEEAHKRLTLSTGGGQISLWNIQGGEIEFDENFSVLTGMKARRFTKDEFLRYLYPDDLQDFNRFSETLYQPSEMLLIRGRFSFGKEDYQWYEFRCRSLKGVRGGRMLAGVMQNVQEQVDRERQLVHAKQMAENAELKQSFLNNMSHEIRTPLNAIVGFTNLLASEEGAEIEAEEKADMLKIINHNNELLLKLINDVVEISRLDSGNMDFEIKEWDMAEIVREVFKTYRPLVRPGLQFRLELDEGQVLPVNIDGARLVQVLSNFLNNANKFTESGRITLGCRVNPQDNEVCVYVEDTGKGIDEKELLMIFDRFYKTDEFEQGSGLGLPISKIIVERLSGRIEVRSKVGQGSRFEVILPLGAFRHPTSAS